MTAPLEQNCSSPFLQNSHSPHESTMQPTPTRSPTLYFVTPSPTADTTPAISWPGTMGKMALPHSSRTWWMSLWQMPANLTSMRTSSSRRSRCSTVRASKAAPALGATRAGVEIKRMSPSWWVATLFGPAQPHPDSFPVHGSARSCATRVTASPAATWRRRGRPGHPSTCGPSRGSSDRPPGPRRTAPSWGSAARGRGGRSAPRRRQAPRARGCSGRRRGWAGSPHLEVAVEDLLHVGDGVEQLSHAAVAEHLARHRDDQGVGGREGVEREHPEARRAVEQHDVVCRVEPLEGRPQDVLATGARKEHGLGTGEVDGRGHEVDALLARDDDVPDLGAAGEDVVDRALDGVGVDTEGEGQARLRVEVDEQDAPTELGERGTDASDGGRLGDPALLVRQGDRRAATVTSGASRAAARGGGAVARGGAGRHAASVSGRAVRTPSSSAGHARHVTEPTRPHSDRGGARRVGRQCATTGSRGQARARAVG